MQKSEFLLNFYKFNSTTSAFPKKVNLLTVEDVVAHHLNIILHYYYTVSHIYCAIESISLVIARDDSGRIPSIAFVLERAFHGPLLAALSIFENPQLPLGIPSKVNRKSESATRFHSRCVVLYRLPRRRVLQAHKHLCMRHLTVKICNECRAALEFPL